MPEVIFSGPAGRLEGKFKKSNIPNAPIILLLHNHPSFGGNMDHPVLYEMFYCFARFGFSVFRFNFRGVGHSEGKFGYGNGELADAAAALDWAQSIVPDASSCWIGGFSFGAWISMQLLMRRPEFESFVCVSTPVSLYDFSFLAPCPGPGLFIHGETDIVSPVAGLNSLVKTLSNQKMAKITENIIPETNHFFDNKVDKIIGCINSYISGYQIKRPKLNYKRRRKQ